MAIKLVQVDIAEPLPVISGTEGYSSVWVLVRKSGLPLGYVRLYNYESEVTPNRLRREIIEQLGDSLMVSRVYEHLAALIPEEERYEPLISVVVCAKDRTELLRHTLDSLLAQRYENFEALVVDNAPSSNETERLLAEYPFRYVMEPHAGHSWARNRGIRESSGEIVAFIDDDMTADSNWLETVAEGFADPEIMCMTGLVLPSELETPAQEHFEVSYGGFCFGFEMNYFGPDTKWQNAPNGLGAETGPHMAFRKDIFRRVGMFDIALGGAIGGGEDLDLLHRIIRAGGRIVYSHEAARFHKHRETMDGFRKQIFGYGKCHMALLTKCLIREPDIRPGVLRFMLKYMAWSAKDIVLSAIGRSKMPFNVIVAEALGVLQGPWAYLRSLKRVQVPNADSV